MDSTAAHLKFSYGAIFGSAVAVFTTPSLVREMKLGLMTNTYGIRRFFFFFLKLFSLFFRTLLQRGCFVVCDIVKFMDPLYALEVG